VYISSCQTLVFVLQYISIGLRQKDVYRRCMRVITVILRLIVGCLYWNTFCILIIIITRKLYCAAKCRSKLRGAGHSTSAKRVTSILRHVVDFDIVIIFHSVLLCAIQTVRLFYCLKLIPIFSQSIVGYFGLDNW